MMRNQKSSQSNNQVNQGSETDQEIDQVTDQVKNLLQILSKGSLSASSLMRVLNLSHRPTFRNNYLHPALDKLCKIACVTVNFDTICSCAKCRSILYAVCTPFCTTIKGFIEMTIPDKPNSRLQKYRITPKGFAFVTGNKENP